MSYRIAVITDVHASLDASHPRRRREFGSVFLLRTVHRLNRFIKPDLVLILGDLIDDPDAPDALDRLRETKHIIDLLHMPSVVIPGNHDPEPDVFYTVFNRPPTIQDVGPVRILTFVDAEEPGYNAKRSSGDLELMAQARYGHNGPIIALQHVPVLPPGKAECPYGYTNIEDILEVTRDQNITLTVAGHYHKGTPLIREGNNAYYVAPALCEEPFRYTLITIDPEGPADVHIETHTLKVPPELELVDSHSHTPFAYCSENMDLNTSPTLAKILGLKGLAFTEHTPHLYFDRSTFAGRTFLRKNIAEHDNLANRMPDYWHMTQPHRDAGVIVGLEVDADFHGDPVLLPEDRQKADLLVGAVHAVPESLKKQRDAEQFTAEFMHIMERFVPSGIHILAHPFRVFRRFQLQPPKDLYVPVARLLKEHGVAAEINFHTNDPDPEFIRICIELGVKIAFGSDAHNMYEVGEFMPHLQLLQQAGFDGDLRDIMFPLPRI